MEDRADSIPVSTQAEAWLKFSPDAQKQANALRVLREPRLDKQEEDKAAHELIKGIWGKVKSLPEYAEGRAAAEEHWRTVRQPQFPYVSFNLGTSRWSVMYRQSSDGSMGLRVVRRNLEGAEQDLKVEDEKWRQGDYWEEHLTSHTDKPRSALDKLLGRKKWRTGTIRYAADDVYKEGTGGSQLMLEARPTVLERARGMVKRLNEDILLARRQSAPGNS